MRVDEIQRHELNDYNLGGLSPPSEVVKKLKELNKDLELVWNDDDHRWEIYLVKGDAFSWQNSAPVLGSTITPGIADWLKKFDTSKAGALDTEDREKRYLEGLKIMLDSDAERKRKQQIESAYERRDVIHYLDRHFDNTRPGWIVKPEGPIIGKFNGKNVRLYKDPFRQTLFKGRF